MSHAPRESHCESMRESSSIGSANVFHDVLPNYLSDDLERLRKRALRIISPSTTYAKALEVCGLSSLHDRGEYLTTKLFHEICRDPNHKLQHLLPDLNESTVILRNN
jgi:hypothetical protein